MAGRKTATGTAARGKTQKRTGLIAAPLGTDLTYLRQALEERGVETFRLDSMEPGQSVFDLVRGAIARADYVIAVIGEGRARENVLFELGIAKGMGREVLVFVPGGEQIPLTLSGMTYLRTDPGNRDAVEFALDQLLSAPGIKPDMVLEGGKKTHPIGELADRLVLQITHPDNEHPLESDLIDIIAQAIRESGVSAIATENQMGDRRPDLAVWSDDLEPWIGNPLVIE